MLGTVGSLIEGWVRITLTTTKIRGRLGEVDTRVDRVVVRVVRGLLRRSSSHLGLHRGVCISHRGVMMLIGWT